MKIQAYQAEAKGVNLWLEECGLKNNKKSNPFQQYTFQQKKEEEGVKEEEEEEDHKHVYFDEKRF